MSVIEIIYFVIDNSPSLRRLKKLIRLCIRLIKCDSFILSFVHYKYVNDIRHKEFFFRKFFVFCMIFKKVNCTSTNNKHLT